MVGDWNAGAVLMAHAAGLLAGTRVSAALHADAKDRARFPIDLAVKFPEFIDYVEKLTKEYYTFAENSELSPVENAPFKVAILNAWGESRAWGFDQGWPEGGIIESLSGQPFDISWISFDEIKKDGIPDDVSKCYFKIVF